ncbi:hypothetical protein RRG08_008751 [Elysia crispata]|uniref:Uncharacterized protein n=1 Tax=Elysia crispata TaxID=231223 RepID=A0AAE0Z981_9GAST|nr:hypothetical protein RRG08_008751 [Elysia crispata]
MNFYLLSLSTSPRNSSVTIRYIFLSQFPYDLYPVAPTVGGLMPVTDEPSEVGSRDEKPLAQISSVAHTPLSPAVSRLQLLQPLDRPLQALYCD